MSELDADVSLQLCDNVFPSQLESTTDPSGENYKRRPADDDAEWNRPSQS